MDCDSPPFIGSLEDYVEERRITGVLRAKSSYNC